MMKELYDEYQDGPLLERFFYKDANWSNMYTFHISSTATTLAKDPNIILSVKTKVLFSNSYSSNNNKGPIRWDVYKHNARYLWQ